MKKILLILTLFAAFQIGTAQDTWNVCSQTVTVNPAPSYDSTFVLEAPSREALAKGMANWVPSSSGGASYKVYTALLTQSGTDAPVATVLENTLGGTVVWSYDSEGTYLAEISGGFDDTKTAIIYPPNGVFGQTRIILSNKVQLDILDETLTHINDGISSVYFEIRVYP